MSQSTGNIDYSFNKNLFYQIFSICFFIFIPFYYLLLIVCYLYIITLKPTKFTEPKGNNRNETSIKILKFFKTITHGSPFQFLKMEKKTDEQNENYIGLSNGSYIKIILAYTFTVCIILDGLIRNLLYSNYVSILQANPLNNPYNNPNTVTKIKDNYILSIVSNYFRIISITFIFLIPFLIPYIIRMFNFDNYDIKKNIWFPYFILFLLFFPFFIVIISRAVFNDKLAIFRDLKKYVNNKDYKFINFIENNFILRFKDIMFFIYIILVYCMYNIICGYFNPDLKKNMIYIYLLLLLFVPIAIFFFSINLLFSNNYSQPVNNKNIIQNVRKNGANSLYDLLVKYNYPCFPL